MWLFWIVHIRIHFWLECLDAGPGPESTWRLDQHFFCGRQEKTGSDHLHSRRHLTLWIPVKEQRKRCLADVNQLKKSKLKCITRITIRPPSTVGSWTLSTFFFPLPLFFFFSTVWKSHLSFWSTVVPRIPKRILLLPWYNISKKEIFSFSFSFFWYY